MVTKAKTPLPLGDLPMGVKANGRAVIAWFGVVEAVVGKKQAWGEEES